MKKKKKNGRKSFNPSMYSANYSKSKNMSVGTVCIKRSKFACMTILCPETVSLVLCQCSITDMQVPPVPNQPKNAEILAQNALKMQIEETIYHFSRERSPEFSYHSGDTPSRALPLHWYYQCHCNFLCINHLQPPQKNCVATHSNLTDRVLSSLFVFLQQIQIINACHHKHSPC